ncbi:MAG: alpha/beta hydrolase [Lachnospiraceae bacterium]|nr:alpha/beta hydrolase [Lachnospiraceae bacterium]
MFYNAKNCNIKIGRTDMDYVEFGYGEKSLIMIPGLGDALKSVKGTAFSYSFMYRIFVKDYKVYVFSRKNQIEKGYTTRNMAADLATVIKKLGIQKASVFGVSQGGMIAQYLAIDYPELVEKLVLAVTLCRPNKISSRVLSNWISLADQNDFKGIFVDMAEKIYTPKRAKMQRPFNHVLSAYMKPKSLNNFIIQATACMTHDSSALIHTIQCPVLIVGGDEDKVVGENASEEMAELINGSRLKIYKGYGHSTYEEAKDFNFQVLKFLNA